MSLSDVVGAVVAVLRRRPDSLLPFYVLGVAVPAIVRVVPFLAVAIAGIYLAATGRLASIQAALDDRQPGLEPPDPNTDPEAFEAWAAGLEPLFEQLFTPALLVLALVTMAVSLVLLVCLSAAVTAGQLTACYARLRDERGLLAGIAGTRRYWRRILGLFILEILCWIGAVLAVGIGAAVVAGVAVAATGSSLFAGLIGLLAGLVLIVVLAVVRALFAFAPVALVVDDTGLVDSLSRTVGFVRARPFEAGFYYAISVGTLLAVSIASGVLTVVNVVSPASLVTGLLLFPAFDLLKTALYGRYRGRLTPPESPSRSLRRQCWDGVRRGIAEMAAFVRETPGTHAFVVALGAVGIGLGWAVAGPFAGAIDTSIAARLESHVPPAAALEFFGNNWLVALATAYSGVAFAVPAIAALLFNGLFIGIYARLEIELVELVAFMVPHGIFEIPALLVASAIGISLGTTAWRTVRGRAPRSALADALERTFWVLIGVGVLLAIAAFLEGFVSPYYYRPFL